MRTGSSRMESPKILIVDDEANVRFILERALSKSGYDVDSAADGKEAIEKISKTAYDLLLLDLEMRPRRGRLDRGTVLRPEIVALAHALRRVVILPEGAQEIRVREPLRIEDDEDD